MIIEFGETSTSPITGPIKNPKLIKTIIWDILVFSNMKRAKKPIKIVIPKIKNTSIINYFSCANNKNLSSFRLFFINVVLIFPNMSEFSLFFEIGAIILSLGILYLLFKILKSLVMLVLHSVLAIVLLLFINFFLHLNITINAISILVVTIGGIPGLILIVLLHVFGLAF